MEAQNCPVSSPEQGGKKQRNKKKKQKQKQKAKESQSTLPLMEEFEASIAHFIKSAKDADWSLQKEKSGLKIFRRSVEGSPITQVKGEALIEYCTMQEMMDLMVVFPDSLAIFDSMFDHGDVVAKLSKDISIFHACYRMPGRPLISDRDFVWVSVDRFITPSLAISYGKTMDLSSIGKEVPEVPGYVRAWLGESGWMWESVEGRQDAVQLTYIVQADPKGWLPTWAVNVAATDQAYNILHIKQHFASKHGQQIEIEKDEEEEEGGKKEERVEETKKEGKMEDMKEDGSETENKKKKNKKKKKKKKSTVQQE